MAPIAGDLNDEVTCMIEVGTSVVTGYASIRIAAVYGFAQIERPEEVRDRLEAVASAGSVLGTLLIAEEGVNGTIAGPERSVESVLDVIRGLPGLASPEIKYAVSDVMPFHRLKVRRKAEIVTMGRPDIAPANGTGAYVAAEAWNALIADPDTILIDTRNGYEGDIGAFVGAVQPNTGSFRDFPEWFEAEGRKLLSGKARPKVAMYCTGGIRCEKATALLKAEGIEEVYHLQGGILRYLETVPQSESLWEGECFVFDERVAVGHGLTPGSHTLCRGCRMPVDAEGRASAHFVEGVSCDRCHGTRSPEQRERYEERRRQMEIAERRGAAHIGRAARQEPK